MAYLGTYQLGQEVRLGIITSNGSLTPSFPTNSPYLKVYDSSLVDVPIPPNLGAWKPIPVTDRYTRTGLFTYGLFLDNRYVAGFYRVYYTYTVGTYQGFEVDYFEIVAGGNPLGAVVGMYPFHMPQGEFLVEHLDGGTILRGRNPYV